MSYDAVISIRPNFAEAILAGRKTVELRRRIPSIEPGLRLWIYSTLPVGAIIATAEVTAIDTGSPEHLWNSFNGRTGITRELFDEYFEGATCGHGITISNVRPGKPFNIEAIRKIRSGFHPPQVMRFLSDEETSSFQSHLFG